LIDEIANAFLQRQADRRLRWYGGGRVRVLIGKVLPDGSAVAQTLDGRRMPFRQALPQRLATEGWAEVGANVFARE
jgi:hypothetical protein